MALTADPAPPVLTRQRCWLHPARPSAARCPSCTRFYCRECVTEHDGRLLCAACLRAKVAAVPAAAARRWRAVARGLGRAGALLVSVGLLWGMFLLFGRTLARIPAKFHEGTLWKQGGNAAPEGAD